MTPAAIVRDLHRLRRFAKDLQAEIERMPRQLKAYQTKVVRQEEAVKQAQEGIKKLKVTVTDKEKTLKAKHTEIAKYEKQRNEATAKKEYDALNVEIAAAREACTKLEEEILGTMGQTDEQVAHLPALDEALQRARLEVTNFDSICKSRQAEMSTELQKSLDQLKEVEELLPVDIRVLYDRLVAGRGEDAMSMVNDRTCTACYTGITAQQTNELIQGMFVCCKSCGRALYLPQ